MKTMGQMDIDFPNLGIYLSDIPKTFDVFGFTIAWYGVIIGCGMILGLLACIRIAKKTGQNSDNYVDFAFYGVLFAVLGARIYFVIFSWDYYKTRPLEILNTRNGGLAIYGGVIAGFLTLYIFTKIKKLSFLQMADTCTFGLLVGQIIGRWGNFMNREAFGEYTDSLFAMRLPLNMVRQGDISESIASHIAEGQNYIQVHPTFLYESFWNLLVLILLYIFHKHKKFQGEVALLYLGLYGLGRFFIEGIRTDQLMIGDTGLAASRVLALLLFIGAILIEFVIRIIKSRYSK